jgi:hypothetical protein
MGLHDLLQEQVYLYLLHSSKKKEQISEEKVRSRRFTRPMGLEDRKKELLE